MASVTRLPIASSDAPSTTAMKSKGPVTASRAVMVARPPFTLVRAFFTPLVFPAAVSTSTYAFIAIAASLSGEPPRGRAEQQEGGRADRGPEIRAEEGNGREGRAPLLGPDAAIEQAVDERHRLVEEDRRGRPRERGIDEGRVTGVAARPVAHGVVRPAIAGEREPGGRQGAKALVDQMGLEQEHDRGLEPAPVRVLGEGPALLLGEAPAELGGDAVQIPAAHELPREVAGERRHHDAVAPGHGRRGLLERHTVAGGPETVGAQDVDVT